VLSLEEGSLGQEGCIRKKKIKEGERQREHRMDRMVKTAETLENGGTR
jgi:hypothetical protein